jgi:hypothetical protein
MRCMRSDFVTIASLSLKTKKEAPLSTQLPQVPIKDAFERWVYNVKSVRVFEVLRLMEVQQYEVGKVINYTHTTRRVILD